MCVTYGDEGGVEKTHANGLLFQPCWNEQDTSRFPLWCARPDGPGIPPGELARVKEPYYRADTARSSETGGFGLGLSIVNDIAFMHGGELHIANRAQGGLSATLLLPRS